MAGGTNKFRGSLVILKMTGRALREVLPPAVVWSQLKALLPDEITYWEEVNQQSLDRDWFMSRMRPSNQTRENQEKVRQVVRDLIRNSEPMAREQVEATYQRCQAEEETVNCQLYVMRIHERPDLFKIGFTAQDLARRCSELTYQHSSLGWSFFPVIGVNIGPGRQNALDIEHIALGYASRMSGEAAVQGKETFKLNEAQAILAVAWAVPEELRK